MGRSRIALLEEVGGLRARLMIPLKDVSSGRGPTQRMSRDTSRGLSFKTCGGQRQGLGHSSANTASGPHLHVLGQAATPTRTHGEAANVGVVGQDLGWGQHEHHGTPSPWERHRAHLGCHHVADPGQRLEDSLAHDAHHRPLQTGKRNSGPGTQPLSIMPYTDRCTLKMFKSKARREAGKAALGPEPVPRGHFLKP